MRRVISFLFGLALFGGGAEAAANPAYQQCLQSAKAYCQTSTAHVKPLHRAKAYQQCYAAARARCGSYNQPNQLQSTPLR
jgi:hypothetical protein